MSRICSENADVAYLFRQLGLFFSDKVSQTGSGRACWSTGRVSFISIVSESQAEGDRLSRVLGEYRKTKRKTATATALAQC